MCALAWSSPQNTVCGEFEAENSSRPSFYAISERAKACYDAPEDADEAAQ